MEEIRFDFIITMAKIKYLITGVLRNVVSNIDVNTIIPAYSEKQAFLILAFKLKKELKNYNISQIAAQAKKSLHISIVR